MTNQTAFSAAEWNLLGEAPLAACAAVALAQPGGGAEREESAILSGWREARALFPESELLQQIIRSLDPLRPNQPPEVVEPLPSFEALRIESSELCRRAILLLRTRATPQEVEDYRRFVLHLANGVAAAASEGGFLGFGATRVSAAEQEMLDLLADVLA